MMPPAAVLMALRAHPPLYAASPIPAAAFALANPLQLAFAVELRRGRRLSCLAAHGGRISDMGIPCSSATISVQCRSSYPVLYLLIEITGIIPCKSVNLIARLNAE